ncbi:hypothetical protein [Bacillus sp. FJAT-45037]|uniref:hypothetical protein n=1 Tax=Bacillus sp. FJAT-45037 TaxID=2011007 RepID=UPI000C2394F9|nr:hypothetical protein [Bacillus sp. FJAT-45037]
MKRFFVFIISFAFLYMVMEVSVGWMLTAQYTPDLHAGEPFPSQEIEFGRVSVIPILMTFLIAAIAYFLSQKISITQQDH